MCFAGGHTTEILRLMECLSAAYAPRHYVIADTDKMSEEKICTFESSKQQSGSKSQVHSCLRVRFGYEEWGHVPASVKGPLNCLLQYI